MELMLTQKPPRSYPAPRLAGGGSYTLEDLEWIALARREDDALREWAHKVVDRENRLALDELMRDADLVPAERVDELPAALAVRGSTGVTTVRGLVRRDRAFVPGVGWRPRAELAEVVGASGGGSWEEIPCTTAELAGLYRAFSSGVEEVGIREYIPKGWLDGAAVVSDRVLEPGDVAARAALRERVGSANITAAGEPGVTQKLDQLPAGSVVTAVVDELDKTAVLELLGVAPGPIIYRRHDGQWYRDDKWLQALQSVKPPPLVKIADPTQIETVAKAVDASTAGTPFDPNAESVEDAGELKRPGRKPGEIAAAGWSAERRLRYALLEMIPLEDLQPYPVVGAPTPEGAKGAERLRQYWLNGEGAAKIMWGAEGDWRRCVAHLSKYLGTRAKGYCNLLHARKLGYWPNQKPQVPTPGVKEQALAKQLAK